MSRKAVLSVQPKIPETQSEVPPTPSPSSFHKQRQGTCSICAEETTLVNLSKNCTHQSDTCVMCLKKDIASRIESKGNYQFQCPVSACEVWFEPYEFYPLLDKRHISLIEKLLLNKVLEKDEGFRWCKSTKGCGAGQLVANHKELMGYYTCYSCGTMLCFRHDIEWHRGLTCEEFEAEKVKNPNFASNATVLALSKQCPNEACRAAIIKAEGCDVMTCCRFGTHDCSEAKDRCDHGGKNYCGQRFCWKCLGKIDVNSNTGAYQRHCKRDCDYYSLN